MSDHNLAKQHSTLKRHHRRCADAACEPRYKGRVHGESFPHIMSDESFLLPGKESVR